MCSSVASVSPRGRVHLKLPLAVGGPVPRLGKQAAPHDERCQAASGTWAPAIYRNGTQGKSARAMRQYSLLKVLFPFSLNPDSELYRLSSS
jgi:hypothetical protein